MEASGRERILDAAYDLFSQHGVRAVGVDAIVERAGVAKATLYRNFESKDDLAIAWLQLREERWTVEWLQTEATRRGSTAAERLLAIFDVFGEWFASDAFDGCSFVNVVLEIDDRDDPIRVAGVEHLVNIRSFLRELVAETGVLDVEEVTRQWHILMKGSIVAAAEGDLQAARRAREMGLLLLERHRDERSRD